MGKKIEQVLKLCKVVGSSGALLDSGPCLTLPQYVGPYSTKACCLRLYPKLKCSSFQLMGGEEKGQLSRLWVDIIFNLNNIEKWINASVMKMKFCTVVMMIERGTYKLTKKCTIGLIIQHFFAGRFRSCMWFFCLLLTTDYLC